MHCLFCSPFKSHTSHCGEAVLCRAGQHVSMLAECKYPCTSVTGLCNSSQMWKEFDSTRFHPPWHPVSLHPPCSECVCHHTSSAISTQFPAQRAQLTIEICGMFIMGVMTLQRLQVLACANHNRCSSHVLLTVISICPDGMVSWLPLVSSTCLRGPTAVSGDMTRKPSANAPSTTTHPEELM